MTVRPFASSRPRTRSDGLGFRIKRYGPVWIEYIISEIRPARDGHDRRVTQRRGGPIRPQTHRGVEQTEAEPGGARHRSRQHGRRAPAKRAYRPRAEGQKRTSQRTKGLIRTRIPNSGSLSVPRVHGTDGSLLLDAGARECAPREALSERHHGKCCARASNSSRPGS